MDGYGSAQGAVESLLSSLALVLRDKDRLPGDVGRDVQCISDEMESMNGFLLDLNEASEDNDHQVQAWKKQVKNVAVESERWVQQHHQWAGTTPRSGGILGYLRRKQHSLLTASERRHIATKIQELKARAHEVGERGQRYGIDVPSRNERWLQDHPLADLDPGNETEEEQCARRRWLVDPIEPYITEEDNKNLISWLTEEGVHIPQVRVIQVVGIGRLGKNSLIKLYYQDAVRTRFSLSVWITLPAGEHSLVRMLEQLVLNLQKQAGVRQDVLHVMDKVTLFLKDKKFLITFDGIYTASTWEMLCSTLSNIGGTIGSALIGITQDSGFLISSSGRTLNKVVNRANMYHGRATRLLKTANREDEKNRVLFDIIIKLRPDTFCCNMLLHLLYVNPRRTLEQLQCWCDKLYTYGGWNNTRHMLLFCYNGLQNDHRSCLLYLSIFPVGWRIRRSCLVRRWVAEGLISRRSGISALEAADLCFNALLDRGLLVCVHSSAWGKAKFIQIPYQVLQFIVERAIAENFADLNLPPNFAPFLSPGNGIQLQQVPKEQRPDVTASSRWQSIGCNCKHGVTVVEPVVQRDIIWLLGLLPTFERQGLIKVLALDSCKGFAKHHLKNISQISELRYLNLRGTDVTQLPEDIHKLYNLETLDIRQTKVTMLPANIVYLRMIKHILSGNIEDIRQLQPREQQKQTAPPRPPPPPPPPPPRQQQQLQEQHEEEDDDEDEFDDEDEEEDGDEFDNEDEGEAEDGDEFDNEDEGEAEDGDEVYSNIFGCHESFSAVSMPHGIRHMTEMQVLSHVEISTNNFDKLIPDLEHLQKLQKLGIVVHGKMEPHLHKLLRAIEKLGRCLRSLSIQFKPEPGNGNTNDSINQITLPMFLQSIKLSGFIDGLPSCVLRLSQLVKVTLRESFLRNTDLRRLGQFANLSSLCLMFIRSYEGASHLVLQRYEYQNLKFLVVKQSFIQHLSFQEGAAPRLQNLQWTNSMVNTLSGINHLWRLTDIVFSGSIVSNGVRQAIAVDPRSINVVY